MTGVERCYRENLPRLLVAKGKAQMLPAFTEVRGGISIHHGGSPIPGSWTLASGVPVRPPTLLLPGRMCFSTRMRMKAH